jgi:hypothetical protein
VFCLNVSPASTVSSPLQTRLLRVRCRCFERRDAPCPTTSGSGFRRQFVGAAHAASPVDRAPTCTGDRLAGRRSGSPPTARREHRTRRRLLTDPRRVARLRVARSSIGVCRRLHRCAPGRDRLSNVVIRDRLTSTRSRLGPRWTLRCGRLARRMAGRRRVMLRRTPLSSGAGSCHAAVARRASAPRPRGHAHLSQVHNGLTGQTLRARTAVA